MVAVIAAVRLILERQLGWPPPMIVDSGSDYSFTVSPPTAALSTPTGGKLS